MISKNATPSIVDTIPQNSSCSGDDSTITVRVSGGVGQIKYSLDGANFQVSLYFENLPAMLLPDSDNAAVVLKKPEMEVSVPVLGTEKGKFNNTPHAPVQSITPPGVEIPLAEELKPATVGVFKAPLKNVVTAIGNPEAYGMIDPIAA